MNTERKTHIIDASGQALGRIASRAAYLLMGKGKRTYLPNVDAGDIVLVKNITEAKFTGQKLTQKEYKKYSGYPGGLKRVGLGKMFAERPQEVLRRAVLRMLPKNKLQAGRINRLKFE